MGRLSIKYVQHLTRGPADLAPDIVEVYIGSSGGKVSITIGRHGFILADPVMHMITEKIKRLAIATTGVKLPVVVFVGKLSWLSAVVCLCSFRKRTVLAARS